MTNTVAIKGCREVVLPGTHDVHQVFGVGQVRVWVMASKIWQDVAVEAGIRRQAHFFHKNLAQIRSGD